MPRSSARWIVAMPSASLALPYTLDMGMQPSPIADTVGPVAPSCLVFTKSRLPGQRELPARRCRHRKRHGDDQPALLARHRCDLAPVGAGDRADDRQAE